ncbi:GNAT family N-acetyltransferase [Pseudalkalibacillus caeni]|uniref:GNAT family N-acetyltransferase n=1 Tax=Exobacillus caeni TaxID=2574798 RepID=A0A5R9F2A3_9BACL|nr:GNAT family N-acetyltransferase [Pseudalkalibacillus caeni]TLS37211.1 GNAT family N-acetyltransferase [Pseudalkalibacillus caeni]
MEPILLNIPTELTTDRLLLRVPEPGDGPEVNEVSNKSLPQLRPWLKFAQKVQSIDETETFLREAKAEFIMRKSLTYLIFKESRFIGNISLFHIDWKFPKFEIAYWLSTDENGNGYMTEAVKAVTELAFTQLDAVRVEIKVATPNDKSRGIPEKLGFELEGILKKADKHPDGYYYDVALYAKTN